MRKEAFEQAMRQPYRAAMFDIDGTLTEPGHSIIPQALIEKIAAISLKIPMALCTGRRWEGMLERLEQFIVAAKNPAKARENWFLFLENGAIGVHYNAATKKYERFYQVDWPKQTISKEMAFEALEPLITERVPCTGRENESSLGFYPHGREGMTKQELAQKTDLMANIARAFLDGKPGSETVRVIDSGVAIHVIPIDGDKDRGIREFAGILMKSRKLHLGEKNRQILIVGDQPGPGYNDEQFLKGDWGTPFSAEHEPKGHFYPIPIIKGEKILRGPDATLHLLSEIHFSSGSER